MAVELSNYDTSELVMARRLHIELKGDSPDLGTHDEGVSLNFVSAFAKRLRDAYQRSAQAVITGSVQNDGRLPARAAEVDIRLKSAKGGIEADLAPVDMSPQDAPIADELPEKAIAMLLLNIRGAANDPESPTIPRVYRALIGSLPPSVRQNYQMVDSVTGKILDEITFTSKSFGAAKDLVLANVTRVAVRVKAISFDPNSTVTFDVVDDTPIRAVATQALVERAFALRDADDLIATLVENSSGHRLLALAPAAVPFPAREPTERETAERYAEILAILAK